MAGFDGDPDHPILPAPWSWELVDFVYRRDPRDWRESYIDMVFTRDGVERRLRFFAPQDLEMSRGLPNSFGMCILDVNGRQLEGLQVRVANFEQSYGAPSFWAARVVEVTEQGMAEPSAAADGGGHVAVWGFTAPRAPAAAERGRSAGRSGSSDSGPSPGRPGPMGRRSRFAAGGQGSGRTRRCS